MEIFSLPILATAISIVICWALFAILCSQINEAIAQVLSERGRFMKKYLLQQLRDNPNGINWGSLLYNQGTIDLLSRAPGKPTNDISPELFAKTMIDLVGNTHLVKVKLDEVNMSNPYQQKVLKNFNAAIQVLFPSDVLSLFKQSLQDAELKATELNQSMDESKVYQHLVINLMGWHKELMQRISLWYQKKTRVRLFFLGLLLGTIINVDSIQLFNFFNNNSAARSSVLNFYTNNKNQLESLASKYQSSLTRDSDSLGKITTTMGHYESRLDSLQKAAVLPVGTDQNLLSLLIKNRPISWPTIVWKILGLLITGAAMSFGAPFWFDLLRKGYTKNKL